MIKAVRKWRKSLEDLQTVVRGRVKDVDSLVCGVSPLWYRRIVLFVCRLALVRVLEALA